MKALRLIFFIALYVTLVPVMGQVVTQPKSPVLDRVTVDPNTGYAHISWLPGGSPHISCHVIYTYQNNFGNAVDTVRPPDLTNYIYSASAARYKSEAYVVAAMDSSHNISPLSNSLRTIFLSIVNDTCNGRIQLSWTPYLNPAHPATLYNIYMSVNGSAPSLHQTVGITTVNFDLEGYLHNSEYCFYVVAANSSEELSSSNRQCITSGREAPPSWTEIESIVADNGLVTLNSRYDQTSDITAFLGEKLALPATTWQPFDTVQASGEMAILNDFKGNTDTINLYRISALNNCGNPVAYSQPVRNMVLKCQLEIKEVLLTWNSPFTGEPAIYSVWRNTGYGFSMVADDINDTLWTDDYSTFGEEVNTGLVRYYIAAVKPGAPAGITECRSEYASLIPVENVFMANAFTPNGDERNDTFAPVLSFTPVTYEFRIYSRQGTLLFHTSNPGVPWNGYNGSIPMPAGVYLWNLKLTPPSGKVIQKSGTVTILP